MALTQQDKEEMYQYLITRGKSLGSLDEGDSNLSNKYLAPVLEYSGGTASKAVRLAVSQLKGDSAYQDWVKQPENAGKTLSDFFQSLKGVKGDTGPVANLTIGTVASGETPDASITGEGSDYKLNLILKEGEKGDTGKTPVLVSVDAQSGETPSGNFTANGFDESGNPKYTLNLTLPKGSIGDTGPAPILEFGEVTTVEPSDPASATFQPNGVDPSGANKYRLGLSIPKGKSGQDGTGAGNVLVNNETSLLASKQYAFKPGQDGSVNGAFVEVEASGGAIEIPAGIMDLDASATSDQILAVWPMEDILKVIKGKPGGVYYTYMEGGVAYVQVLATPSENPTVTPHDVILTILLVPPGEDFIQAMNISIETDESTVSITGIVLNAIGTVVNAHDPNLYSGVLVPVKDKETGTVLFNPWYEATSYQYVLLDIDSLKTDTSVQIKENLKRSPIIVERTDVGRTEFLALRDILFSYGSVIGVTNSGSMMFMDSSIVHESSILMYFKGGETLYTVTLSEDPTTKDLSATVVESGIGQSNHTLDLSPLFDSEGSPVSAVTDEFIAELQNAYEKKYSNCTAKFFSDAIIPMAIQKEASSYKIELSSALGNDSGLAFAGYYFVINSVLKTLAFTAKDAQLETAGDGSKFLSNDGTYKAISSGAGNVYNLDIDISGEISKLDANMQKLAWGKTYTAPTNDNIVELLGGTEGIRQLCEKLAPANNPVVTVPFLAYVFPSTLISSAVLINTLNSAGNESVPLVDGCRINIMLQFQVNIDKPSNITVSISITNFNTSTQTAAYSFSLTEQSSGQTTEVLDILTSTNSNAALSANQGRVLKGLIDNFSGTTVVNNLTSTSTTSALSAAQGKALKTLVDGKVGSSEITTIKKLTQSAYDALSSKDSKTLYIIV